MKVLVIGGTGAVGSQVVRALLERKVEVTVLSRNAERQKGLPGGVKAVVGDLMSLETIKTAFRGYDGCFLLNVVGTTEAHEGLMAVNGAKQGGVRRVVYLSVQDADVAAHLPHFGAKLSVEAALKVAGMEHTVLRPNNFHQNDYWFKDVILQHRVYPQPLGAAGVSRVDTRDIGDVAAIALTEQGHDGQTYNLVGPDRMTGASTAEIWSRALGRPIAYAGDDLEAWEKQSLQYMPDWLVFDFKMMYEHFQTKGFRAAPGDVERLTKILGHAPRSFEAFAMETAAAWKRGA